MDLFEQIYRRSSGKVYRYLLSLCGDTELAEELTAETFYRAYLHIDRFEGRCSVDTWLCEIGKNTWLESVRKGKRFLPLEEGAIRSQDALLWQKIEDRDQALQLHKALHALREPYREVFFAEGVWGTEILRDSPDLWDIRVLGEDDLLSRQE